MPDHLYYQIREAPRWVNEVNPHLFPAVLLHTVEHLVRVGQPERQQLKVFVVSLQQEHVFA